LINSLTVSADLVFYNFITKGDPMKKLQKNKIETIKTIKLFIVFIFISSASLLLTAQENNASKEFSKAILTCHENINDSSSQSLRVFDRQTFDNIAQVTLGAYHTTSLICPNAAVLFELKKDIRCIGIDKSSKRQSDIIDITINMTDEGHYKWKDYNCK